MRRPTRQLDLFAAAPDGQRRSAKGAGHEMFGRCTRCDCSFDIDLPALGHERGTDCEIVGIAPVRCPRCGARTPEIRVLGAQAVPD